MSSISETIIDLKNIKEEMTKLAKQEFFEKHSKSIEDKTKKLFEERLFGEEVESEELEDETPKEEIESESPKEVSTTTNDYFDDYLDKELDNTSKKDSDSGDIEITIDLGDNQNAEVKDISEEDDIDTIMNEINALSEDDEIEIKDDNLNQNKDCMNDNVKSEMAKAKELYEDDVNSALAKLTEPDENENQEMDIDEALQSLSEIENELCSTEEDDDNSIEESSMEDETEGTIALKEDESEIEFDDELMEAIESLDDNEVDRILSTQDIPEEELEEGISGSVSLYNAKRTGDSDTSYGKKEHELNEQAKAINKKFAILSKKANQLIKENITLKESVKTLKEVNGTYEDKLKTYGSKLYEAMVIAKKTACANKLMLEHTLSEDEKIDVVKSFDKITSREQADKIYSTLNESFSKNDRISTLNEIENKISNVKYSGASKLTEQSVFNNPALDKMKKLIFEDTRAK